MAIRWNYRWVDGEGGELDFAQPDALDVLGRSGDLGAPPYEMAVETDATGAEAAAARVSFSRGRALIPALVSAPAGTELWDYVDELAYAMRPLLSDGTPNRGWLYFSRSRQIATPDVWRIPAAPAPWAGWRESHRDPEGYFVTEFGFTLLSAAWEIDPPTRDAAVIKAAADAAWSSHQWTETPGGSAPALPGWEIDGPAAGTINTVRLENLTTGHHLELTNLGLATGQTLVITTGFLQKRVTVAGVSQYSRRTATSRFWELRPGANDLLITKDASTQSAVRLTYRKRVYGL